MDNNVDVFSLDTLSIQKSQLIREQLVAQEVNPDREAYLSDVLELVEAMDN